MDISRSGPSEALFQVKVYEGLNDPDLIMFREDQQKGNHVAQARLPTHNHEYFEIYIGPQKSPTDTDWNTVQCIREGMLKSQSYHFRAGQRRMAWKRMHDSALGASKVPHTGESFKLVDESDVGKRASAHTHYANAWGGVRVIASGDVMAVHLAQAGHQDRGGAESQHGCGRIDLREEFGDEVEVGALITLMVVLERNRRHTRQH